MWLWFQLFLYAIVHAVKLGQIELTVQFNYRVCVPNIQQHLLTTNIGGQDTGAEGKRLQVRLPVATAELCHLNQDSLPKHSLVIVIEILCKPLFPFLPLSSSISIPSSWHRKPLLCIKD